MMRFLLLGCCCLLASALSAQQLPDPQGCGYDHYIHALEQSYPGFRAALPSRPVPEVPLLKKDQTIYTIPVVVHVVWQKEEQNLPEATIQSVIDVLNEDFRRLNANAGDIRPEFAGVVGDPGIEFELRAIERVKTSATFKLNLLGGTLPDNVKQTDTGGSTAWDTKRYLNIWVCNIEGGSLLGYAYPPANLKNWPEGASAPSPGVDGVVIHYPVFRRTGEYTAKGLLGLGEQTIPVRGRTITHEVGHYLGLRHIWGDGLLSIIGLPDCNADDGIADTPQQGSSSQFVCDPKRNSCQEASGADLPDMFENFMDYAAEDCSNSFTVQQIAIMRSVLENERSGLVQTSTTNTSDPLAAASLRVYPNPASDRLTIEAPQLTTTPYSLRLLDMQGRTLRTLRGIESNRIELPLTDLPAGLYSLIVQQGSHQLTQRIVLQ